MGVREDLASLRGRVVAAIEQAAKTGDTGRIMDLSDLLRGIEADEKTAVNLEERLTGHEERLLGRGTATPSRYPPTPAIEKSAKQRGKETREKFASERGLALVKGALYRSHSGARIGIATATEAKPNKWFLGLPDSELDCAVLLCQKGTERLDFVLPMNSISGVWPCLSRSGDQVKFNVLRRNDGAYQLQYPGQGPLDIGPFLRQYAPLY